MSIFDICDRFRQQISVNQHPLQMVADAMAAEMADLRHVAAEVEAERDEAAEEVARLGGELDRLQQEWASDSAEFKVRNCALKAVCNFLKVSSIAGPGACCICS